MRVAAAVIGALATISAAWIASRPRRDSDRGQARDAYPLRIGGSLALIAAGAILMFGLQVEVSGVDIPVVGFVLLVIGVVAALISIFRRRAA